MDTDEKIAMTRPAKTSVVHMSWGLLVKSAGLKPSNDYSVQLIRSLAVSGVSVIANFGAAFILKEIVGLHYLLGTAGAFLAGVFVNYYMSTYWVFANRKLTSKHAEILISVIVMGIGMLLNLVIIFCLVEYVHVGYWLALSFSTIVVFFWNFIIRKKLLY
jgi:putative flippase GtrA